MEGCVYIISNKSLPTLKIGRTTKTAIKRGKQFDNAAIPHRFVAEYELRVKYHHEQLEEKVHRLLSSKWYGGECFQCNVEYAVQIIKEAASEFNVIDEIFYWVETAKKDALHEIAEAQAELGYAYYKGYGVPQDYKQAKDWFEKAAIQGNAKAQNYLGLIYQNKQGFEIKTSEKLELLNGTIKQLGFDDVNISNEYINIAIEWFEKSVKQGNAEAQFNLANLYYNRPFVEDSRKKAFELFIKSAEQGNKNAQFYLGEMYQYGNVVEKNIKESKYWYLKAIESDENILGKVIETCLGKKTF